MGFGYAQVILHRPTERLVQQLRHPPHELRRPAVHEVLAAQQFLFTGAYRVRRQTVRVRSSLCVRTGEARGSSYPEDDL